MNSSDRPEIVQTFPLAEREGYSPSAIEFKFRGDAFEARFIRYQSEQEAGLEDLNGSLPLKRPRIIRRFLGQLGLLQLNHFV